MGKLLMFPGARRRPLAPEQVPLDMPLPPDNGDRRPACDRCIARPGDIIHEDRFYCGACALEHFEDCFFDDISGPTWEAL